MKKLTGIYKITNNINNKVYIGKALNIGSRFKTHLTISKWEQEIKLYEAFLEFGIENFTFSIAELCSEELISDREMFYIEKYNSYKNGYNMTDYNNTPLTKENVRITKEQAIEIRKRRFNKEDKDLVFKDYAEFLSHDGFQKVWTYQTWKNIGQEFNTEEIRQYYIKTSHDNLKTLQKTKASSNQKLEIKTRKLNGEKVGKAFEDYSDIYSFSGFRKLWYKV